MAEVLAEKGRATNQSGQAQEELQRERQYSSAAIGMLLPFGVELEDVIARLGAAERNGCVD